ncbi:MAG: alanine--glyoxylate aminotransferase family protein [Bacteroidetes bacterium]|nr:alanine--glyoxylate aminotransferase family protein [Bacteroidota bacterium]MCL6098254.1 alanine--glyoxylate aminotransferase family protein [Bacteroidota bacterium]
MHNSFKPHKRILMGPGPSNVNPKVLDAMSKAPLGHLDPQFIELMDEIKSLLKYTFKTENESTFVLSGPGSLGMEACLVNLVEPGDKVIVCVGGYFANRMTQIVEKIGGNVVVVKETWGRAIEPAKLEDALKTNPDTKVVAFVHAETSTGALSNIKQLSEIAHKYNCLTIADTVTSLGATDVYVDEWNLDAVYSCSQKGLACVAGMSPIIFSERAVQHIKNRKTPIQSWFNDLNLLSVYWSGVKRIYHHTAPSNQFYGLHEALLILKEEGIENAWRRHKENSAKFISKLKQLGLDPFVPEGERIPNLITVKIPSDTDEAKVRNELLNKHNLEIGAGLGELAGKIWRIGLMGYNSNEKMIDYCVGALKDVLNK